MTYCTLRNRAAAQVREASLPGLSSLGHSSTPIAHSLGKVFPAVGRTVVKRSTARTVRKRPAAQPRAKASSSLVLPLALDSLAARKQSVLATPGIGRLARNGQVTACEQLTMGKAAAPNCENSVQFLCLDYADTLLERGEPAHVLEKIWLPSCSKCQQSV